MELLQIAARGEFPGSAGFNVLEFLGLTELAVIENLKAAIIQLNQRGAFDQSRGRLRYRAAGLDQRLLVSTRPNEYQQRDER